MKPSLVFDFDGTLVRSNSIKRNAFFAVAERLGDVRDALTSILDAKPGDRSVVFRLLTERVAPLRPAGTTAEAWTQQLIEDYGARVEEAIVAGPEVPGAQAALRHLASQGHPLFLNSATPREALLPIVRRRGWSGFFNGIYGGPPTKKENFERLFREHRIGPTEILFVGDGDDDAQVADVLGIPFLRLDESGAKTGAAKDMREVEAIITNNRWGKP